jgi:hypothetical protein
MRRAGTNAAANQRVILPRCADDGGGDGGAWNHDITIDRERGLGLRADNREEEEKRRDGSHEADAPNDALVAARSRLCNKGGHAVAPERAEISRTRRWQVYGLGAWRVEVYLTMRAQAPN